MNFTCCNKANLQLNFEVLNIRANSLLQNGFVFMVHTVFFGQLIFRKIIKIVATRGHILRLKCTKFDFGWGSAPDAAGRAYSAPQIAGFKGPTSRVREGRGRERKKGKGREREVRKCTVPPPTFE